MVPSGPMSGDIPKACLERYEVRKLLATGGYGRVYLASQTALSRPVVIKVLTLAGLESDTERARFIQEAQLTARLAHPNIVTLLDFGVDEGRPWIVYEFIEGGSLEDTLNRSPPSGALALTMAYEVLEGLELAHDAGIWHRDLKPSNVMITTGGQFKLIDLGAAKSIRGSRIDSESGVLIGTPSYMAPERLRCQPEDARSDLYALGAMMYRCATGALPLTGAHSGEILWAHLHRRPRPPEQINPDLDADLADLIMSCLAKDPAERPASAASMRRELEVIMTRDLSQRWRVPSASGGLRREETTETEPLTPAVQPPPGAGTARGLVAVLATVTLAVAAGLSLRVPAAPDPVTPATPSVATAPAVDPQVRLTILDLEKRARRFHREYLPSRAQFGVDPDTHFAELLAQVPMGLETHQIGANLQEKLSREDRAAGSMERGILSATAAAHHFAGWARLWCMYESYHVLQRLYTGFYPGDAETAAQEAEDLDRRIEASGLAGWVRSTSTAFGPMLLGRFRQQLADFMSDHPLEAMPPELLARLAWAIFVTAQFAEELIRNLEEDRRNQTSESAPAAQATLDKYLAEFTGLQQLLLEQATVGAGDRSLIASFLVSVLRFGAGRNPEVEWLERQKQAQEVLSLLEKARSLGPVSRELHQLVEKPYQDP